MISLGILSTFVVVVVVVGEAKNGLKAALAYTKVVWFVYTLPLCCVLLCRQTTTALR